MKRSQNKGADFTRMANRLDCFGDYFSQDPLCRKYCALRLRCAIERDRENIHERTMDIALVDFQPGLK